MTEPTVQEKLEALLPPRRAEEDDWRVEVPLERDMYRNPHGLGRGWTPEQRATVRLRALRESIVAGILLVPKERRDDDSIIGQIVRIARVAAHVDDTPVDQLETALEALWIRVIHASFGATPQAKEWMHHAAGLLGEIR